MEKRFLVSVAGVCMVLALITPVLGGDDVLQYPCYLVDAYDADNSCWAGMDA